MRHATINNKTNTIDHLTNIDDVDDHDAYGIPMMHMGSPPEVFIIRCKDRSRVKSQIGIANE